MAKYNERTWFMKIERKSRELRWKEKKAKREQWHDWFAWRPVRVSDTEKLWWITVQRKGEHRYDWEGTSYWDYEYREKKPINQSPPPITRVKKYYSPRVKPIPTMSPEEIAKVNKVINVIKKINSDLIEDFTTCQSLLKANKPLSRRDKETLNNFWKKYK